MIEGALDHFLDFVHRSIVNNDHKVADLKGVVLECVGLKDTAELLRSPARFDGGIAPPKRPVLMRIVNVTQEYPNRAGNGSPVSLRAPNCFSEQWTPLSLRSLLTLRV